MKYLKTFENYEELFDYNIDDIKAILGLRDINNPSIEFIGEGSYGSAFKLNGNKVLKITSLENEIYYANKIKNISSDKIVKVYDAFFNEYYDVGYTVKNPFILMEHLDTNIDPSLRRFIDYLNGRNPLASKVNTAKDSEIISYFKELLYKDEDKILEYWSIYKGIVNECLKYNLPIDDLRGNNIGMSNGNYKFFDISNIHTSKDYDYSDIDVVKHYPSSL